MTRKEPMTDAVFGNRILDSLPDSDAAGIARELEDVALNIRHTLYHANEPITHIYFPVNCVLSVLAVMRNGAAVEISTIGYEGLSGSQLVFGAERPESSMICQVAGDAKRLPTPVFLHYFESSKTFRRLVYAYTESLFNFMGQSIACNRLHTLNERCARWLLSTQDRVGADQFFLTQEFLAIMLGTSRPAITVAAGALQEAGLISYHRGHVVIRDREGLTNASCECYQVTARSIERSMGAAARSLADGSVKR